MNKKLILAGLLWLVMAQSAIGQNNPSLPTDADLAKARQRAADVFSKIPEAGAVQRQAQSKPVMPKIEALPKPAIPAPDIAAIAEQYKTLGQRAGVSGKSPNDLMVFVSLSMPKAALERIIGQAEKTGATLVFRGLKNDSMKEMATEVAKLVGKRHVGSVIHPPAFQQFSVKQVPALVMAKAEASNVLQDGCAQADTFVKVTGDVTIQYALEYIERHSPEWAPQAQGYLKKLKPEMLK